MTRRLLTLMLAAGTALAHAEAPVPDAAFAARWIDTAYVGRHQALSAAGERFAVAAKALCAKPGDASLQAARNAWREAMLAWRTMDGATGGPMVLERSGRMLDFRPTRTQEIEKRIAAGEPVDPHNVSVRGLPAAEYLLYGDAQPKAQLARLRQAARCAYLQGVAERALLDIRQLDAGWTLYLTQLQGEADFFRRNLLAETIGLMLSGIEGAIRRLPRVEEAEPDAWPDWRSGLTKPALAAQLDGFATAYFGADGTDGLSAFVASQGHAKVNTLIKARYDAARTALAALPEQPVRQGTAQRDAVRNALVALKAALAGELAGALEVVLGFNDSDGD
ncbi:imelysin family protein [Chitiniphilus purpureus]|uniref:Imelysin family protein n=1 Tax=Chitiniphilus purpureus TaxID=2981137 RepID=A0ABY6DVN4_9NEIS|nr:imelysin family protein [Chitiniphilus sp. CD1]UXY15913.1 imelysin family protein [Chitiniphilus sp. CD1]